jgi:hypothetical protein
MESETKTCQNCKTNFVIGPEDFDFYRKIDVPAPTFCPQCRMQRRFAFRNQRKLFKRKCSHSGKEIFSMHNDRVLFPVYEREVWFSDVWDPMDYGIDFDFSRPFFEQFRELSNTVPRPARSIVRLENSDYSNNATDLKNCYLVFNSNHCEDCMYGINNNDSKACIDCLYIFDCENCYQSVFLDHCNKVNYSLSCHDSFNLWFSKNCNGCHDCFGCVNLRNKSYCIWNEQYSREEYEKNLQSMRVNEYEQREILRKKAQDFWQTFPVKYTEMLKSYNSTGGYIYNSENVRDSYLVSGGKDLRHCQFLSVPTSSDSYDVAIWGNNVQESYESFVVGGGVSRVKFSLYSYENVHDLEYCDSCHQSSYLFGCVGLRHKQYCIFNKQYTQQEYEELVPKIRKHMNDMVYKDSMGNVYSYGEFFPAEFSSVPYNISLAQEFFPQNEQQVKERGYLWESETIPPYTVTQKAKELPNTIAEVTDDILQDVIASEESNKVYRITNAELSFYRNFNIPLPRTHYEERYEMLRTHMLPPKLYKRTTEDGIEVMTSFAPDRVEKIYSEEGYNRLVN